MPTDEHIITHWSIKRSGAGMRIVGKRGEADVKIQAVAVHVAPDGRVLAQEARGATTVVYTLAAGSIASKRDIEFMRARMLQIKQDAADAEVNCIALADENGELRAKLAKLTDGSRLIHDNTSASLQSAEEHILQLEDYIIQERARVDRAEAERGAIAVQAERAAQRIMQLEAELAKAKLDFEDAAEGIVTNWQARAEAAERRIEQLEDDLETERDMVRNMQYDAAVERTQLRAALEQIADMCPTTSELTIAHMMAEEARAALATR